MEARRVCRRGESGTRGGEGWRVREREKGREGEREQSKEAERRASLIYGLIFPGVRSQLILRFNCFVTRPTKESFDLINRIRRMSPPGPDKRDESLCTGKEEPSLVFVFFVHLSRPAVISFALSAASNWRHVS